MTCHSAVRPLTNNVFPMGFQELLRNKNVRMETIQNERGLLNYILGTPRRLYAYADLTVAVIHRMDPDVIVGHNFTGFDLDVLLHRMKDLKVDHWSRLGRLRRSVYVW